MISSKEETGGRSDGRPPQPVRKRKLVSCGPCISVAIVVSIGPHFVLVPFFSSTGPGWRLCFALIFRPQRIEGGVNNRWTDGLGEVGIVHGAWWPRLRIFAHVLSLSYQLLFVGTCLLGDIYYVKGLVKLRAQRALLCCHRLARLLVQMQYIQVARYVGALHPPLLTIIMCPAHI